jgi:hypothetical protein
VAGCDPPGRSLAILVVLPFVPDPVSVGAFLYVALSQLVQAATSDVGCEIVGIPTLVLHRRYTLYCALNGADVVEHWLRGQPRWITWSLAQVTLVLTTSLGGLAQLIASASGFFAA